MNFKAKLSERIGLAEIQEITFLTQGNNNRKQELFNLLFETDEKVAYQATWAFTHFNRSENEWLYDKQNELIDEALVCRHPGKRRLLLSMLFSQPLTNPPRVDFLDFCLEKMMSKQEPPSVQALCMKLAYEMCRRIPELLQELHVLLDLMESELHDASMRAAHKNVVKAMRTGKTLQ